MPTGSILVADDDAAIRTVLNQALSRAGYEVRSTSNAATLWRWISQGDGDLVITDVVMPDENAFDLIPRIRKARPNLPIVVMSAQNTFMTAIRASELGAYEYLPKPFDLKELIAIVGRALSEPKEKRPAAAKPDDFDSIPLVGRSPAMQEIYRVLARLMQTDLTVMITGESGTGKELVARALHDYGKRRTGTFVAINMAAIPRDLIESELFGHEKGAFTGANTRSSGRFEQAEGGTLFLDEIGDMPMEAQTRLLRVLQQGEYTTVGGRTPIKSDVRIIAATNKDLRLLIQQGLFREDLFFRLNVVPLRLPPLRERSGTTLRRKNRSSRNRPCWIKSRSSLLEAAMMRTSLFIGVRPPTVVYSPCCSTRNNRVCASIGMSPISSRKSVPPSACSKRPELRVLAPVNAPFSCPNNSDSIRSRGIAAILMATKVPVRRLP